MREHNDSIFVANEIEEKLAHIQPKEDSDDQVIIEELAWDECEKYLEKLSQKHHEYKPDYDAYLELLRWSELTKLKSLNQYIELTELLSSDGELYKKSDLYGVVKAELWEKAANYVFDLQLQSISQDDFSRLLYLMMRNRKMISTSIYEYIRETIFNKIGLKYSTVVKILGE